MIRYFIYCLFVLNDMILYFLPALLLLTLPILLMIIKWQLKAPHSEEELQPRDKTSKFIEDYIEPIYIPEAAIFLILWAYYGVWLGFWPFNTEIIQNPKSFAEIIGSIIENSFVIGAIILLLAVFILYAILSIISHIKDGNWIISFGKDGIKTKESLDKAEHEARLSYKQRDSEIKELKKRLKITTAESKRLKKIDETKTEYIQRLKGRLSITSELLEEILRKQ